MRVVVTGGSGRIGSRLVKQLVDDGHEVVNVDRRQAAQPVARFVYADVGSREQMQYILEGADAVCHLAEIPNAACPFSPDEIYWHNTRACSVVLQTAVEQQVKRIIYTSTCQVYGCWSTPTVPPKHLPFDESHPLQPQNCYAVSKVANEFYAHLVAERHHASIAIFRFPAVWNLAENRERALRWTKTQEVGSLEAMGSYVEMQDAARAYSLALNRTEPGCEAYHFVADDIASPSSIHEWLAQQGKNYPPLDPDWPAFRCPISTEKAFRDFGWKPQFSLLER